jgi:hypothetical protein
MLKTIKILLIGTLFFAVIYYILGQLGITPIRHCDTTMGPNGPVHFCEWYSGPERVY